eukprot:s1297_g25.t1
MFLRRQGTKKLENKVDKPSDAAAVLPVVPAASLQQVSAVFTRATAQATCHEQSQVPKLKLVFRLSDRT